MRIPVEFTGWNTRGRNSTRAINIRVEDGILRPCPTLVRQWEFYPGYPRPTEKISSYLALDIPDSSGVSQRRCIALTEGWSPTGTQPYVSHPVTKYLEIRQGKFTEDLAPANEFQSGGEPVEFLTWGGRIYVNNHISFWDILSHPTNSYRIFQLGDGRLQITNRYETQMLSLNVATYDAALATNISSASSTGTYWRIVTSSGNFTFGFDIGSYSSLLGEVYNNIPRNSTEIFFLFKADQTGTLVMKLLDSSGNVVDVMDSKSVSMTPHSIMKGRGIAIDFNKLLSSEIDIDKIQFEGKDFPAATTFDFYLFGSGTLCFESVTPSLPTGLSYLRWSIVPTTGGIPDGVAIEKTPEVFSSPQVRKYQSHALRDSSVLLAYLSNGVAFPSSIAFRTYFLTAGSTLAKANPIVLSYTSTVANWMFSDLRDTTLAYNGNWEGKSFPHVDDSSSPVIRSACFWNNRLVLALENNRLWISAAGNPFAFDSSVGGDILALNFPVRQVVPTDNALFLASPSGLYALAGEPGAFVVRPVLPEEAREEGYSTSYLILKRGVYREDGTELTEPIRHEIEDGWWMIREVNPTKDGAYLVAENRVTGERVLWELYQGGWLKHDFTLSGDNITLHAASFEPGVGLTVGSTGGIYRFTGIRATGWEYTTQVIAMEESFLRSIDLVGQGQCDLYVNNELIARGVTLPNRVYNDLLSPVLEGYEFAITLKSESSTRPTPEFELRELWVDLQPTGVPENTVI